MNMIHLSVKSFILNLSVEISASASITDLKEAVFHQCDIPTDEQMLLFQGRVLDDNLSLSDYNLTTNDLAIQLVQVDSRSDNEDDDDSSLSWAVDSEGEEEDDSLYTLSEVSQELLALVRSSDDDDDDFDDLYSSDDEEDEDNQTMMTQDTQPFYFSDEDLFQRVDREVRAHREQSIQRNLPTMMDMVSIDSESVYTTTSTIYEIEVIPASETSGSTTTEPKPTFSLEFEDDNTISETETETETEDDDEDEEDTLLDLCSSTSIVPIIILINALLSALFLCVSEMMIETPEEEEEEEDVEEVEETPVSSKKMVRRANVKVIGSRTTTVSRMVDGKAKEMEFEFGGKGVVGLGGEKKMWGPMVNQDGVGQFAEVI